MTIKPVITVPTRPSSLHTIVCFEQVDKSKIDDILKDKSVNSHIKKQLEKYKKKFINDSKALVRYFHSGKFQTGRVFVEGGVGLQMLKHTIRDRLANKYMVIDVVNAYPTILNQLCEHHGIEHKYLNFYVEEREKVLSSIKLDISSTKDLYIRLLHGGSIYAWREAHDAQTVPIFQFPYGFEREMVVVRNAICAKNKSLQKKAKNKRTVLSQVLQYHENCILECMFEYLKQKNIIKENNCVFTFDGIMVLKNNIDISDLSEYIYKKTGFKLDLTCKHIS